MMPISRNGFLRKLFVAALALAFVALPVLADEGITVTGVGTNKVKPQIAELTGVVTAEAELAADAVVKYQDNKRRAIESIKALGLEGIEIVGEGVMISSATDPNQVQAMMMGQAPPAGAQQVTVAEKLKVTLSGIDKMDETQVVEALTSIVDAGKDAGVVLGGAPANMIQVQLRGNTSQPLAIFRLSDPDTEREQATEAAMDDARAQAHSLAALAGVELGKVVSISQIAAPANGSEDPEVALISRIYGADEQPQDTEPRSDVFSPIEVKTYLQVRFAIE